MKRTRKSSKTKHHEDELIFIKHPPLSKRFIEDSEDDESSTEGTSLYIQQVVRNQKLTLAYRKHSALVLPYQLVAISPLLHSSTRTPWSEDPGSIPNLEILRVRDEVPSRRARPFSSENAEVRDNVPGRRVRPFSAKPRVIRKRHLKWGSSEKEKTIPKQEDLPVTSQALEVENNKTNVAPEEPLTLASLKLRLDDDRSPRHPRHPRLPDSGYPYTKLHPLPNRHSPIQPIMEEDESEANNDTTSTSKTLPAERSHNTKPKDMKPLFISKTLPAESSHNTKPHDMKPPSISKNLPAESSHNTKPSNMKPHSTSKPLPTESSNKTKPNNMKPRSTSKPLPAEGSTKTKPNNMKPRSTSKPLPAEGSTKTKPNNMKPRSTSKPLPAENSNKTKPNNMKPRSTSKSLPAEGSHNTKPKNMKPRSTSRTLPAEGSHNTKPNDTKHGPRTKKK